MNVPWEGVAASIMFGGDGGVWGVGCGAVVVAVVVVVVGGGGGAGDVYTCGAEDWNVRLGDAQSGFEGLPRNAPPRTTKPAFGRPRAMVLRVDANRIAMRSRPRIPRQ